MSEDQSATATATERGRRKVRTGVVVSDKMDKTVLVRIDRTVTHPLYRKTVRRCLKPDGASFVGTADPLVSGNPLNVSDVEVDRDGFTFLEADGELLRRINRLFR